MCVSGCPYKKIYYNWKSGKAESASSAIRASRRPADRVCSETCVGRIRYLGAVFYDADRIRRPPAQHEKRPVPGQLDIFLDPNDPKVIGRRMPTAFPTPGWRPRRTARSTRWRGLEGRAAAAPGIPHAADGLVRAAAQSPIQPRPTPGRSVRMARSPTSTSCASRRTSPTC